MAKIIAICNQKGGVGKTTTAVNLAACLAAAEKETLLLDLDPQANATTGVGIDKNQVQKSIYEVLIDQEPVQASILGTELGHLSLLPSHNALVGAELELVNTVSRETVLKKALATLSEVYEYIIIDCPPSLGLLTLNALTCADFVLIPVQCEYYALEGLASLKKTIDLVKQRLNQRLVIKGIVLTMFDPRNNLARQVVDEIQKHFKEAVFNVIIPRNVRLSEAPSHGKPVILYDIKSKGALAYFELAQEVLAQDYEILRDVSPRSGREGEAPSPRSGVEGATRAPKDNQKEIFHATDTEEGVGEQSGRNVQRNEQGDGQVDSPQPTSCGSVSGDTESSSD